MKRITALLIFFAFAFASIAGAEPHAFKSYKLDAPMAEYIADRKFRCEPGPLPLADHQCATFGETIADRNVKRLDLYFYDERLSMISITLDQKDYRHVAATLAARYGAPTETSTRQLQNRMGAAVESEVVAWSGTESRLHGNQHDGRMDESSITFRMNDHMRKFAERKKRSSAGSVKDL